MVKLPPSAALVNAAIASGAKLSEITKLVELDTALGENIARLARSAAYTSAVGEKVSLPYALMRLGREGVRAACFTSTLAKPALRPGPLLPLRSRVWRECIASALACQALAGSKAPEHDAYLLGLLHDFGKILALGIVEGALAPGDAGTFAGIGASFFADAAERHHCDLGWIVTDAWHLPEPIPTVTARHHVRDDDDPLHGLVTVADRVVREAARRRWQISAEDIERIDGIYTRDEAMSVRIAIAKHPYVYTAVTG